jgi:four helix bundle protein
MSVLNYTELVAWQKAMDLVQDVYLATKAFPKEEKYGLTTQMQRAAVSIPSNIAEGQGRSGRGEFRHHLSIAHGSLRELETQLVIALRLGYLSPSPPPTAHRPLARSSQKANWISGRGSKSSTASSEPVPSGLQTTRPSASNRIMMPRLEPRSVLTRSPG